MIHAEAARREADGFLGVGEVRGPHRGDIGAAGREGWLKEGRIVRATDAMRAWTRVPRRKDDRDTTPSELHEHVADLDGVVTGNRLFLFAVRDRDDLGYLVVGLVEEVDEPFEIRLVGARGLGLGLGGDQGTAAARAVLEDGSRVADCVDVLDIEVCFTCAGKIRM